MNRFIGINWTFLTRYAWESGAFKTKKRFTGMNWTWTFLTRYEREDRSGWTDSLE